MSDIFISYKREEQPIARKLADALEGEGWTVWWDPKLRAGERFNDVIEKALKESKCVVVMWSKRSVESLYVKDEATYALNRNKLVPVMIEGLELPFRFEGLHTPSLLGWDGSRDTPGFRRLIEDISAIVGRPATERQKGEVHTSVRKDAEDVRCEPTTTGYPSPLEFVTFVRTDPTNKNIRTAGITVKNESRDRLQYCSIRIEKIQPSDPKSIYWIVSDSQLAMLPPTEEVFALNPYDHTDVAIAQVDSINARFENLGIELLCYCTQKYRALDLEQSYVVTIRGSAEIGTPIERDYRLWVDELKQLCFKTINEDSAALR
jgi:TIR domain